MIAEEIALAIALFRSNNYCKETYFSRTDDQAVISAEMVWQCPSIMVETLIALTLNPQLMSFRKWGTTLAFQTLRPRFSRANSETH